MVALRNVVRVLRLHVVGNGNSFVMSACHCMNKSKFLIAKITLHKCFAEQVVSSLSVDCKAFLDLVYCG